MFVLLKRDIPFCEFRLGKELQLSLILSSSFLPHCIYVRVLNKKRSVCGTGVACHSIVAHDTNRERKRKRKTSQRPWSNLPEDILQLVVERLYVVYRIHLHAVCKNWVLTPIHDIPSIDKLSWILNYCFSPHHTICSLSYPYRKGPYIIEKERGWIPTRSLLFRATACASRCGWVLFSEKIRQYYVYNPLTKEIISLHRLELPQHDYHFEHFATFSSNPTSSDCVFVVPTICDRGQYFFISTYSIGNKTWKTHNFTCLHPYFFSTHELSSFHIATQEWRLLSNEPPLINEWNFTKETRYFVAHEVDRAPGCNIFRYDWLDGAWKKMESLEGGALFLGKPSFGVSREQTKMVANRVYYFSSHTSKPSFLVYGSTGMEEKSDKSDKSVCSQTSQNKIY
ncbi:hypothetical protein PVL29_009211 [Vitis rotundifolia]|uniref:DUF295 domain-containing protein n=1 Tax=Vitis rotundifolia TaxID=103349 RepID=A0AA38ZXV0_VITRO|nr:hypothetical protein PVL29_009211 [Vitis rotundifolia]